MKSNKRKRKWIIYLFAMGVGLLNGFFGGGGGMLSVPLMEKGLKVESKKAHATTLAVILPISMISASVYIFKNKIEILNISMLSIGVLVGGIIGAFLLKKLNNKVIKFIFAIIMLIAGIKMVI